jgi:hypothetical protein
VAIDEMHEARKLCSRQRRLRRWASDRHRSLPKTANKLMAVDSSHDWVDIPK